MSLLGRQLGTHEEVAYAAKKQADHLKHNNRKVAASDIYARVYKLYDLFGPELKTQQVIVLKEWSDCEGNIDDALKKLFLAETILKDHYMQTHSWFRTVRARINQLLKQKDIAKGK